jgi:lycopene beta-cyclase
LNILSNKKLEGRKIFSELFRKNKPSKILKFLDNETSLAEEFKLLNTLPKLPFIKAGIEQLGK